MSLSKYERQYIRLGVCDRDHGRHPHKHLLKSHILKKYDKKSCLKRIRYLQKQLYKYKALKDQVWVEIYYGLLATFRTYLGYLKGKA